MFCLVTSFRAYKFLYSGIPVTAGIMVHIAIHVATPHIFILLLIRPTDSKFGILYLTN